MRRSIALAGGLLMAVTCVALAHHAFDEEFDWKKPVTLTGTVNRMEMANPHSYLYINSTTTAGSAGRITEEWKIEMGSWNQLMSSGWKDNSVKMGDRITIEAWLSKSNATSVAAKSVTLPDGKSLPAGFAIVEMSGKKEK